MMPMEDVRVCRACGRIDPVEQRGRCPSCGLFTELDIVSRQEAERLARRVRRRVWRRRLIRLAVVLIVLGGVTAWALGVFFDRGPSPPKATTDISASIAPHTWPQSRRTPENSGFTPDQAPFPHRVAWTYQTSKPILTSPAVVETHVYLATGDGRVVTLHQETGQLVWEYRTDWPSSSSPAVAGDMVIVAIRPGRVIALNRHTGKVLWDRDMTHPILASPIVVHGTVYIGAGDKRLHALDAATGQRLWTFATTDWVISTVAHAGDRIVVAARDSSLYVVGAETGRQRLVYETGVGRHIGVGPAIHGARAYFGSVGGRVWAIDWQATSYPLERALLFWQGNLFLWGVLSKPPVQKGTVWSRRVGGDVRHTPTIAHNTIYVATAKKQVVALEAMTGSERWRTDVGVEITAAPTVAGTTVLIGTQHGTVFGLQAETGQLLWDFKTGGRVVGSPIVAGDTMYVVSDDGMLYAVRRSE